MTMVPYPNLSGKNKHFRGGHVARGQFSKYATECCKSRSREEGRFDDVMNRSEEGYECNYYSREREEEEEGDIIGINGNWLLGSDLAVNCDMAHDDDDHQEDSRTNSDHHLHNEEGEEGSTSKHQRHDDTWLQLGIGGASTASPSNNKHEVTGLSLLDSLTTTTTGLVELDLLTPGGGRLVRPPSSAPAFQTRPAGLSGAAAFFLHPGPAGLGMAGGTSHGPFQEISWGFRPVGPQSYLLPNSPSPSSLMGMGSYFGRPFPVQSGSNMAGPSADVRVIAPPRRPHSGVWFMLQASPNQVKEPFLPQIPKSYLRIKDGRMTIRLLMKYLANKLRLGSESEIEIRCRGQPLLPLLTLQHVRDTIWTTSPHFNLHLPNPHSHHVMLLHYSTTL